MNDLSRYADQPLRFILRYLGLYRWAHAAILIAVTLAVVCSVSTQYGVKYLVDALSGGTDHERVWIGFALLAGLIAADNLLWRVASWIGNSTYVNVTGSVRRDLFGHLTGHAPSFFQSQPPGSLTSRISATSNAFYTAETMATFNVIPPLIATVVSIGFLATVSLWMAIGLTLVGGVIVAVIFRLASRAKPLHHAYANEAAAVDGQMVDVVSNMALVKAFGRVTSEHHRLSGALKKEMLARKRSLYYLERLRILHAVTTAVLTFGLLAWAISLWDQGRATPGDVILVCTLGLSVLSATRDLAVALVDVTQHFARLSEALRTLLAPHAMGPRPSAVPLKPNARSVEFRDVSFAYPGGREVMSSLSFKIEPGEQVGIVGPSGGGKTTIMALMQRFYEAQTGSILIDGEDVREVTDETLRKAIAVVAQDVTLFHRSLRENIRYGRPGATDDEIWAAAIAARCDEFIGAMPHGLDTVVGDRGTKLSGGQRQRIAIARAFLKDAPILLLDEATSALDTHSEEVIREALDGLMQGRTVMAIAHRLSTLKNFSRIMVVENGKVIEDGRPEQLISGGGAYKTLLDLELSRLKSLRKAA
jgi:ATP-binding cassette, subfamily B, bacterial